MAIRERIVIVGGGIAGLALATQLGKRLGRTDRADITLLDRSGAHVWKPMLHTFAAGTANSYQQRISFVAQAARCSFRFLPGAMQQIDRAAQQITVSPVVSARGEEVLGERIIPYDSLFLAAGSKANDFGTPGVVEHCQFIDDLQQAEAFNDRLYTDLLRTAELGKPLTIAIVGGGATGVELAAEISQLLDIVASYGAGNLRPKLELTLIESGPRILAAFPEEVAQAATEQLRTLGINVRTGTRVVSADANGFILDDGSRIEASLRVWAAGVKAQDVIAALNGFELTPSGQVKVGPTLQATTGDRVFALGDCASFTPVGALRPLPPTAQVARQQAMHLGRHVPRWLEGQPIPPFSVRDLGSLVSLSRYNAFGTLGRHGLFRNRFIRGRFAQLSHAMLYRLHQAELHGLGRASMIWLSDAIASAVRPKIRMD
ncbi:FAD-dependent oxidoreductase [Falsochrobactrum shanghaiense]|uniref:FAD-dependent oxidoreductase n=1 Tax=Falsochrobactrum shanghaiense TaxID=2201899 RepID=A0A316JGI8_9HYPH|nr:NAD(P)/FAD-dependent oxidoreductase [Falsochrobactrum shanghaiense]PWL18343.1 FAD-dependent oxidoreductase [Falsochrobactrum shanghaiense]